MMISQRIASHCLYGVCLLLLSVAAHAQLPANKLLFGVAYYDEYMPYERLNKDVAMMKDAGINVVRIAESTRRTPEHSRTPGYTANREAMQHAYATSIRHKKINIYYLYQQR
jgi:hypothetical protein